MSAPKSLSDVIVPWLKDNLGPKCTGILTGTDLRALKASVLIVDLMTSAGYLPTLCGAFAAVVREMQPQSRFLAYHAIACASDWSYRELIWQKSGLETIPSPPLCRWETSL
jgi:hypothetical protein